ncbi:MAG: hypothetical protein IPI03_11945 [Rubrivivax sp.]|nr:hypothetical protein [Rubrivivax sp.]MBK7262527.1 hypothetical protein [Rubrivivax sp.]
MSSSPFEPCIPVGPVQCGTLVARDADAVVRAYRESLDLVVISDGPLPKALATAWGQSDLAGARFVVLGADAADASTHWLRIIEWPLAEAPLPMRHSGWLALEVLVKDVCALGQRLENGPFTVLGPPRALAVNDNIWAMQVAGPAGETLYLTEVRAPVPPFDLPAPATFTAERLFIPVLSAREHSTAMGWYEQLSGQAGLRFDTRVSALNAALGLDPEWRRPVGTLQLAGASMIEIDHVPEHSGAPACASGLPSGLAMVSFHARRDVALPPGTTWQAHGATAVALMQGPAGEWIELLAP